MRKLPLALACALIFGSSSAFAMGLGEVQTQSNLNQPLRVTIPITDVRPGDADAISVKIGDEAQFARHGYSLMSIYGRIQLQVVGGQRPHILLTSDSPVRDPVLGLVLEVEGPSGRIERAVSILLDPEGYKPSASGKSVMFSRSASTVPLSDAMNVKDGGLSMLALPPIKDGGPHTAVAGDTAFNIARRVQPEGLTIQQTIAIILRNNPQAFAHPSDPNTLLAGKTLTIPNAQAMRQAGTTMTVTPKPVESKTRPETKPEQAPTPASQLSIVQPITQPAANASSSSAPVLRVETPGSLPEGENSVSDALNSQTTALPVEVQEQIEAAKIENERLTGVLASQDQRLQKMEESLRSKEEELNDTKKKLQAAQAAKAVPAAPVAVPVEATTPWWSYALMGLGALLAAVLAYVAGSRRQPKDGQKAAGVQSVSSVMLDKQAETDVYDPVVASSFAKPVETESSAASTAVIEDAGDPVQAALEEADVMQAYGLHDRAIQLLSDALQDHPGNAVLMVRRARAMHDAGDAEGFLREAQAFREQHPNDETHWEELRALGVANYPSSALFGAIPTEAAFIDEMNSWSQPAVTPVKTDDTVSPIQPLDGLGLGTPESTLEELFNPQAASQTSKASLEMPPLDLDLPAVSSVEKAPTSMAAEPIKLEMPPLDLDLPAVSGVEKAPTSMAAEPVKLEMPPLELDLPAVSNMNSVTNDAVFASVRKAEASFADLNDDQASLELPSVSDVPSAALGIKDAPKQGQVEGISDEDLAMLGIDLTDEDASTLSLDSASASSIEPDFAEDMQFAEPEVATLNLDSVHVSPDKPVHDLSALSLDLGAPEALADSSLAPLELALDQPSNASLSSFQDAVSASPSSGGMMSEHEVKLDIASAYIEMGEHEGAREMLQEVLNSGGDELLKSRASQMLASLSS